MRELLCWALCPLSECVYAARIQNSAYLSSTVQSGTKSFRDGLFALECQSRKLLVPDLYNTGKGTLNSGTGVVEQVSFAAASSGGIGCI